MALQYLVNKKIIFEPQTYRVWSIDDPAVSATLYVPAAHCFSLLVQNAGEVLSQQYLFQEVWEKNGLYVNPNTLYQNMAMLRKTLKSVGLEEEVILTIPRQGFTFVGRMQICQDQDQDQENCDVNEQIINTGSQSVVQATEFKTSLIQIRAISWFCSFGIPLFVIALSLVFLTWQLWGKHTEAITIVDEYYDMGTVDRCQLHSSWQGKYVSVLHFRHILGVTRKSCQAGEHAYLTFIDNNHRSSLIKCSGPINEPNTNCAVYIDQGLFDETH